MRARVRAQHLERARADAARRQVHDALERGVVVAIRDQPQVGERVLDFLALEEPQAAVDAVRDARGEQVFFEHARLRVRAVQDGVVAPVAAARDPLADPVDDELGLVALVVGAVTAGCGVPAPSLVHSFLPMRPLLLRDDRVGRGEDVAGRAVVLLEPEQLHAVEVLAVLLQVLDPRAAPAVDRLVVVADDERDARRARRAPSSTRTGWCSCPGIRRRGRDGSAAR